MLCVCRLYACLCTRTRGLGEWVCVARARAQYDVSVCVRVCVREIEEEIDNASLELI